MGRVSGVGAVAPDLRLIFHAKSGYPDFIRIFVQVRIGPYLLAQG